MANIYTGIEEIRQENTEYAVFAINTNKELFNIYMRLKNEKHNKKYNSEKGLELAQEYAKNNNDMFGDLFITELELVRWNKVLGLL